MHDITLYCTQLRNEEKNIILEAKKQNLPISYSLAKDGFDLTKVSSLSIIRLLSHGSSITLSSILESLGSKVLNSANSIRYCTDKGLTATLAKFYDIPQPNFALVFSAEQLVQTAATLGYPFVIKPVSSSWGRGVCLIKDVFCLDSWLAGRESLDATHKNFPILAQEYIDKPGYDLRVLVIGEQPIVAIKRVANSWITNTHLGAKVEKTVIDGEMTDLIAKIVRVFGSGFFGIDLFITKEGKYLFNEINHNPDFANSSLVHGVNVAQYYVEYIKGVYEKTIH